MRWPNAISILTLTLSVGTLVITAVGTGSTKADGAPPPSMPIAVAAGGLEARLDTLLGSGDVGVIVVGEGSAPSVAPVDSAGVPGPTASAAKPKSPAQASPKPGVPQEPAVPCVDINTASESALITIKGIGPALAAGIAEHRRANGPFKKKEDILKVKGIGPAKFANIEGRICL